MHMLRFLKKNCDNSNRFGFSCPFLSCIVQLCPVLSYVVLLLEL